MVRSVNIAAYDFSDWNRDFDPGDARVFFLRFWLICSGQWRLISQLLQFLWKFRVDADFAILMEILGHRWCWYRNIGGCEYDLFRQYSIVSGIVADGGGSGLDALFWFRRLREYYEEIAIFVWVMRAFFPDFHLNVGLGDSRDVRGFRDFNAKSESENKN